MGDNSKIRKSGALILCVLASIFLFGCGSNNYNVGDIITFGSYEQDGDTSNGAEPIEWIVLDKNDNGTLLVSRFILDAQPYSIYKGTGSWTERPPMTWKDSDLRQWLNGEFYNTAFSEKEQKNIITVTITNSDNMVTGRFGGNNTEDNVFLLSIQELDKYYVTTKKDNIKYTQDLLVETTSYSEHKNPRYHATSIIHFN